MVEPLNGRRDPASAGPFRLLGKLGSGGFGTVYAARRDDEPDEGLTLAGLVAVKLVHPNLAAEEDFRTRFGSEIKAIRRVRCDFVPRFVAAETSDDPLWLATRLIPGPSLDKVVRACGPLPQEAVWQLGAALAETMACIHHADVVHRDFKPQNVLLTSDGAWVIDFSLVHLREAGHRSSSRQAMATYQYAAPEQVRSLEEAGFPADVYALGAALVFAATGHPPHDGSNALQIMLRVLNDKPNLRGLPRSLYDLVEGCLRFRAEHRPSLAQLRAETARHVAGSWRDGWAEALPRNVAAMLTESRVETEALIGLITPLRPVPASAEEGSAGGRARAQTRPTRPSAPARRAATTVPPAAGPRPGADGPAPVAWSTPLGNWTSAPVALAASMLLVTSPDGTVTAVRAADGAPAPWADKVPFPGWPAPVQAGAAIHAGATIRLTRDRQGGTAYVGAANGHVLAIDLASGASGLAADVRAPVEGAPVLAGGQVCVLGADGLVHAIPLGEGYPAVIRELPAGGTGSPAVTSDGKLLVASASGQVHAIDAATGAQAWVAETGGLVLAAPVQAGPWLYLCGTDGVVHEVDAADGTERATSKLPAPVHVTPVLAGDRLYVGTADGAVRAYDTARPGDEPLDPVWEPLSLGEEIGGLAAAGGRVFVTAGHRLVEIDAAWGRWAHDLHLMDRLIGAPPVLADGHCYVADLGGLVECLVVGDGAGPA